MGSCLLPLMWVYLTIIPQARMGSESIGSLRTTTTPLSTTTGSEMCVNAQAQLASVAVRLSSTTSERAVYRRRVMQAEF